MTTCILVLFVVVVFVIVLIRLAKFDENETKIQPTPPRPLTNEEIMWFKEKFPSSATEAIHYFTTVMADKKERHLVKIAEELSISAPRASAICGALVKKGYLCRGEVKVKGKGVLSTYRVQ